ncbi:23S rRNA (adenine(2503)-C(2))-methyltransferase RlmN [Desulfovibrio sp. OttesenSCG-928-C06]|nr:23S rRNA (adenine(2503)-C(2))-methyltransferase RlmN [Desulfovibrio sp. OttesenSCG-928-C06]
MIDILNLTYPELVEFITGMGEKSFRAEQVWRWLWHQGARSFDDMTNVAKSLRAKLAERSFIRWPEVVKESVSQDGTVKFLLKLSDGELVETVLIPSESRSGELRMTQCLSCQVGCAMGCTFCSTGGMGFTRNMTQSEILGQILVGRAYLGDFTKNELLRNLVFMGMGEPLMNFKEVMRCLETLNSESGLAFSRRRVTVSTCGIKKGLAELGESGYAFLAISLHAPDQGLREKLMPRAAHWPLADLLEALEEYPLATRERITFEYLLLGGVNDSIEQATRLARLTQRMGAKINLIVYNPAEGSPYRAPAPEQVLAFEKELWRHGVVAILRKSKGQDIKAACGQLKADVLSGSVADGEDAACGAGAMEERPGE